MAAIEHRGINAVTNFDISRYINSLSPNSNAATSEPPETQPPPSPPPSVPRCRRPRKRRYKSNTDAPKSDESSGSNPASLASCSGFGGEDDQSPTPETDRTRRRSFPDDIQTYFGCHEPIGGSTDVFGDAIIFGELSSYTTYYYSPSSRSILTRTIENNLYRENTGMDFSLNVEEMA